MDSDSSGAESIGSEPDSEDEAFIEENGPFDPGLSTLMGPLLPPDGALEIDGSANLDDDFNGDHSPDSMDVA